MENKEYNTVEDFVFNKSFQEWVLNNDPYSSRFWLDWVSYNPDKTSLVNYSRAVVGSLPTHKRTASEEEINDQIERIISDTKNQPVVLPGDVITPRPRQRVLTISRKNWLMIVAIFALAVACTWYLVTANRGYADPYKSFASGYTNSLKEIVNNADTAQLIILADGSQVRLESKGRLSYTSNPVPGKREVFLTGKARFNISKASSPFFVYTRSAILKATGTVFEIDMLQDKNIMITANRGNLQVFKRRDFRDVNVRLHKLMGIIMTPNQQLVFNEANNVTYKTLVDQPVAVGDKRAALNFVSQSATIIFTALQQQYAIPILFDQEALHTCLLSIDINNRPFFNALDAICKSLHASYEVIDGTVLISAAGCR